MFSPKEIAQNYVAVAQGKVNQKWYKILILAVLAGAYIAVGAVLSTVASSGMTGTQAALIRGAVFPVGLMLVVICGAELFTGNCLLTAPAINKDIAPKPLFKCLGVSYLGNFIGGVLIALLVVFSHAMGGSAAEACVNIAATKCSLSFFDSLLRGIMCNILVCLAVWASMASKSISGKILAVYLPIFAFVVCGFEHSVANMYYLTAGFLTSAEYAISSNGLGFFGAVFNNLIPVTLGNIIGGVLIAVAYWAVYLKKDRVKENPPAQKSDENN